MTTAVKALDVDGLLAAARDKTGLTDFGDEWFVEPLRVLVAALAGEARLSELGLTLTRRRLTALLADRLRLRRLQAENPAAGRIPARDLDAVVGDLLPPAVSRRRARG
jgi:hypothetical protein